MSRATTENRINSDAALPLVIASKAAPSAQPIIFRQGPSIERARLDLSGRLLVGTSSSYTIGGGSEAKTQIAEEGGALTLSLTNYVNASSGSYLALGASRGTTVGNFTIVQNNDRLGQIRFAGADGVDLQSIAAEIRSEVDGVPGGNDMPGRLIFSTTDSGGASPTERMRIRSDGNISVGNAGTEYQKFGIMELSQKMMVAQQKHVVFVLRGE